jgi:chemotaxis family two-component system response regulator Rcp1
MKGNQMGRPIEILLVDDNPGDVRLTIEALKDGKIANHVSVVNDGVEAMAFLRHEGPYAEVPRPDIVLLDLNMPKKSGHEVLAEMKEDPSLKHIPVAVLTTSAAEADILRTYEHRGNCYITKSGDFEQFMRVIQSIETFWFTIVSLPSE